MGKRKRTQSTACSNSDLVIMLQFSHMTFHRGRRIALAVRLSAILYVSIYYITNIQDALNTHELACGASQVTGDVQLCANLLEWLTQLTIYLFVNPFAVLLFPLVIFAFSLVIYFAMAFAGAVQRTIDSYGQRRPNG